MGSGVAEWCAKKDPLLTFPSSRGSLHVGKIVVSDCFELEIVDGGNEAYGEDREEPGAERREEKEDDGGETESQE
jgi:hypothetical protein